MLIVFGSLNMDISAQVPALPKGGETVITDTYHFFPGGKGANQAFAAGRFGSRTVMVGKVGDDAFGTILFETLKREGVTCSGIARCETPTGCAFIARDTNGENQIVVMAGANSEVSADQVPDEILKEGNYLLIQMEVPIVEIEKLVTRAKAHGVKVILNLAPAIDLPRSLYSKLDYLIVNKHEAKQIADRLNLNVQNNAALIAKALAAEGQLTCIVTLGERGSIAVDTKGEAYGISAYPLTKEQIVDTTGAGDCYCGTLAAALHERKTLGEAMRLATVASALSCKTAGAQTSYPYIDDVVKEAETIKLPEKVKIE
ncbi:MAG: ribokinase [Alphaproteobacteria bacterium]|nr:ribokinase [Alphaproteobacteria bacterium]